MANRPLERLILRVPGGEPSILFRRNNVQWTEDGDDLPHFSRRLLHNRFSVWLNERQAFLWPHAGIVAEASYFAAYCRGARKLFVYATDRPRGDRSTGASKIALEIERVLDYQIERGLEGMHHAVLDVFMTDVHETRGAGGGRPSPHNRARATP